MLAAKYFPAARSDIALLLSALRAATTDLAHAPPWLRKMGPDLVRAIHVLNIINAHVNKPTSSSEALAAATTTEISAQDFSSPFGAGSEKLARLLAKVRYVVDAEISSRGHMTTRPAATATAADALHAKFVVLMGLLAGVFDELRNMERGGMAAMQGRNFEVVDFGMDFEEEDLKHCAFDDDVPKCYEGGRDMSWWITRGGDTVDAAEPDGGNELADLPSKSKMHRAAVSKWKEVVNGKGNWAMASRDKGALATGIDDDTGISKAGKRRGQSKEDAAREIEQELGQKGVIWYLSLTFLIPFVLWFVALGCGGVIAGQKLNHATLPLKIGFLLLFPELLLCTLSIYLIISHHTTASQKLLLLLTPLIVSSGAVAVGALTIQAELRKDWSYPGQLIPKCNEETGLRFFFDRCGEYETHRISKAPQASFVDIWVFAVSRIASVLGPLVGLWWWRKLWRRRLGKGYKSLGQTF